jgi:hypothetical protein
MRIDNSKLVGTPGKYKSFSLDNPDRKAIDIIMKSLPCLSFVDFAL